MSNQPSNENEFINKLAEIVQEHISDEHFGVSELAREMGLSRSSLHRKVKEYLKISVIQFISHQRLKYALDLLQHTSYTVSEVSYRAGFNSPSYFIKCFREYYGYSPSKVESRDEIESTVTDNTTKQRKIIIVSSIILGLILILSAIIVFKPFFPEKIKLEKTLAIRTPLNIIDSSNYRIIKTIMIGVNGKLSEVNDLNVKPWTSALKYEGSDKDDFEVGKKLKVNFIISCFVKQYEEKILLQINISNAKKNRIIDDHQFQLPDKNQQKLEEDISNYIIDRLKSKITRNEKLRIKSFKTKNDSAYHYYSKALDVYYQGYSSDIFSEKRSTFFEAAIPYFEKAIEFDNEFAFAYAELAKTYFYHYTFLEEKDISVILDNATKAILYDNKSATTLLAVGLYYEITEQYYEANKYFKMVLEYNPNDEYALLMLMLNYVNNTVDLEKGIEYALKVRKLDVRAITFHENFFNVQCSWALRNAGFFDEAEQVVNKYLEIDSKNPFYILEKVYLLHNRYDGDLQKPRELLLSQSENNILNSSTYMLAMAQNYFYTREFKKAYFWYSKLVNLSKKNNVKTYISNIRLGYTHSALGNKELAEEYIAKHELKIRKSQSSFNSLELTRLHTVRGEFDEAIYNLRIFSKVEYPYIAILELRDDPIYDNIRDHPEFQKILDGMEDKFWNEHNRIRASLEKKDLLPLVFE